MMIGRCLVMTVLLGMLSQSVAQVITENTLLEKWHLNVMLYSYPFEHDPGGKYASMFLMVDHSGKASYVLRREGAEEFEIERATVDERSRALLLSACREATVVYVSGATPRPYSSPAERPKRALTLAVSVRSLKASIDFSTAIESKTKAPKAFREVIQRMERIIRQISAEKRKP